MTTKEDYECWAAGKELAAEARGEANAISVLKDMGFPAEQIAEVQARLAAKSSSALK